MTAIHDSEAKYICHTCIGDQFLSDEVNKEGTSVICSYCSETREAMTLEDLADRIHEVIETHFERTSSEPDWFSSIMLRETMLDFWVPDGEPVVGLMADIACVTEEIAIDLTDLLSGRFRYWAIKEGGEDPYDSEACYEERRPDDFGFRYTWRAFCNEIMYRERIFPENAEPVLEEIFGDPSALETYDGTPVVREVNPSDEFPIWRARTAQSKEELIAIIKNPAQQLGPPPHKSANAGRMNQKGIPVFYGALDETTCVSEVRPPVGSKVVIGRFSLLRPVRLLDLGALSRVYVNVSHFDPNYSVLHGRASFIRNLVDEISRPIMPQDADREYLPTQFVASYLARKVIPNFDGIIFPSSQIEGNCQNVVLFNHARGVEKHELPVGSEVEVYLSSFSEDDDSVFVSETTPLNLPDNEALVEEPQRGRIRLSIDEELGEPEEDLPPTLNLDIDSVQVLNIESFTYHSKKQGVRRHRQTTEERDNFNTPLADVDFASLLEMGGQSTSEDQP